jgi:hypothetical protein
LTLLAPPGLEAQNPSFAYSVVGPTKVGGAPGEPVMFTYRVQMSIGGLGPRDEGPRGWSLAVRAAGGAAGAPGCRIVGVTTDGTVAGPAASGGLRARDGFEKTELTSGAGNEGAVSAVTLSNGQNLFLPAAHSPADILVVTVEGRAPPDGCVPCTLSFPESLEGSGQPVPNVVSYRNQSFTPRVGAARVEVCGACFENEPQIGPWRSLDVGDVYAGAARASREGCYEICGTGLGHGATADEFQALSTFGRGDMELAVEIRDLLPAGEAGVCIRNNTRFPGSQYMGIALRRTAAGGLQVVSSIRPEKDGKAVPTNPAAIQRLPIVLAVRRTGGRMTTLFGSDLGSLREHSSEDISKTELAHDSQELVMFCASGGQGQSRALFCNPRVSIIPTSQPPVITSVSPTIGPLEGGIEVKITGSELCPERGATEVLIAGIPAKVKECSDNALVVEIGPSDDVVQGDVVVRTPLGEEVYPNGFLYVGRRVARADCNCDGKYDIADALAKLGFLFLGSDPCCCFHALDSNGDRKGDIADPLTDLAFLFLGGSLPPPAPFPLPGPSPDVPCDLPEPPELISISRPSIRAGDVVTIRGRGFSPMPEENMVLFGSDARGEVLDASDTGLTVRVPELVNGGRVAVAVLRIPGILALLCKTSQCSPVISGLGLTSELFVERIPSILTVLATSKPSDDGVVLSFNRDAYKPGQVLAVQGGFSLPPIQDLSYGNIHFGFEHVDSTARSFEDFLTGFGDSLRRQLRSGGAGAAVDVAVDARAGSIAMRVDDRVLEIVEDLGAIVSVFWQNCRCDGFDPDLNERDYGWCRFTDLITSCNGIPRFQYFIPDHLVMQQSDAIFPLADPLSYSPSEKRVLYNRDAYCHVRKHNLWNPCKLTKLRDDGETEIPEFPCKGIVMKTQWRTAGSLPAVPDPDDLYYHYDHNGTRYYLTLLHYTDKSRKDWHWADLYVDEADGGDTGGCGGSKVGMPAGAPWVAPWSNYSMCTNITDPPGPDCGNLEIPVECVQTCQGCHDGATFGTLKKDFLFSIGGGPNTPGSPDCD